MDDFKEWYLCDVVALNPDPGYVTVRVGNYDADVPVAPGVRLQVGDRCSVERRDGVSTATGKVGPPVPPPAPVQPSREDQDDYARHVGAPWQQPPAPVQPEPDPPWPPAFFGAGEGKPPPPLYEAEVLARQAGQWWAARILTELDSVRGQLAELRKILDDERRERRGERDG